MYGISKYAANLLTFKNFSYVSRVNSKMTPISNRARSGFFCLKKRVVHIRLKANCMQKKVTAEQ